ncbi:MAG: hypothetical protein WDN75_20410 [Bacteroidota bacterium]
MLGIPTVSIDRTVRLAISGLNAGKFSDADGDDFEIVVTKAKEEHPTWRRLKIFMLTAQWARQYR